ncbi:MAG: SGNH/GDSL hydrolase family protein [Mucilaginibacter polytrichastri]|nr:SGNH/GDSL hydrolase family protein [Mucilaginibacter polytrichastri]
MKFKSMMFLLAVAVSVAFVPPKKKKVVFFGDSITQAGVGEDGYITLMKKMLEQQGNSNYELVGAGIGGNKVYDLYLRLDEVTQQMPDITVIYVGINDVWHKTLANTGTDPDKFEKFYRALVAKLQAAGSKVVICTPSVIGEKNDNSNQQDGDLNAYSTIIRTIATDMKLPLIDLRKAFVDYELKNNPENKEKEILTVDRVHLNPKGNQFVAETMWNVLKTVQ